MFDIGWTELLLIALVAIVVIGPKDLPRVMRMVGQWTRKLKRMGSEFQNQFNEALREAELDDVRKGIEDLRSINPLNSVREELTKASDDIKKGMDVSAVSAGLERATAAEPPAIEATAAAPAVPTPTPVAAPTPPVSAPTPAAAAAEPVEKMAPPAEPAAAAAGEGKP